MRNRWLTAALLFAVLLAGAGEVRAQLQPLVVGWERYFSVTWQASSTDTSGAFVGAGDFDAQCTRVFANIGAALASAGAGWGQVVSSRPT